MNSYDSVHSIWYGVQLIIIIIHNDNDNNYYGIVYDYNNNNNTQIAAIALPPSTMHPQLWVELLTFKHKCTIT